MLAVKHLRYYHGIIGEQQRKIIGEQRVPVVSQVELGIFLTRPSFVDADKLAMTRILFVETS